MRNEVRKARPKIKTSNNKKNYKLVLTRKTELIKLPKRKIKKKAVLKAFLCRIRYPRLQQALCLRYTANNFFCTLNDITNNKTIFSCVSSKFGLKLTAKRIYYESTRMIGFCKKLIWNKMLGTGLLIKINSSKLVRRKIYRWCKKYLVKYRYRIHRRRRALFFVYNQNKAYNGCRAKKKRRKKRIRRRYFKNAN